KESEGTSKRKDRDDVGNKNRVILYKQRKTDKEKSSLFPTTSKAATPATFKAATQQLQSSNPATTIPTTTLATGELIKLTTLVSSPRRPEIPIGEVVKTKSQSQVYSTEDIEGENKDKSEGESKSIGENEGESEGEDESEVA
ncbi:20716_t:CDS:2, partial [Racocetra persica]